jgi:hypothetical protein
MPSTVKKSSDFPILLLNLQSKSKVKSQKSKCLRQIALIALIMQIEYVTA